MSDALICFHCLTRENRHSPAVTAHRGTLLCELHARGEIEDQEENLRGLEDLVRRAAER